MAKGLLFWEQRSQDKPGAGDRARTNQEARAAEPETRCISLLLGLGRICQGICKRGRWGKTCRVWSRSVSVFY